MTHFTFAVAYVGMSENIRQSTKEQAGGMCAIYVTNQFPLKKNKLKTYPEGQFSKPSHFPATWHTGMTDEAGLTCEISCGEQGPSL